MPARSGSLDNAGSAAPVFTPSLVADAQVATLTVTVSDGVDSIQQAIDVTLTDSITVGGGMFGPRPDTPLGSGTNLNSYLPGRM